MQVEIDDEKKIVFIWTPHNAKQEIPQANGVEEIVNQYSKEQYRICIYESGKQDIKMNMLNLFSHNLG